MNALILFLATAVNLVLSLFTGFVLLRFFLQQVKADFYNPICQFLIKITNPLLIPLRRIIPGYFKMDLAALFLAYLSMLVAVIILSLLTTLSLSPWLFFAALIKTFIIAVDIFFYAIFLRAIISWFQPNPYHPATQILIQLTEPLLFYARRIFPPTARFDFSPWLVLVVLVLIRYGLNQAYATNF